MFWADQIVKDLKSKGFQLVDDMYTPSGKAHIGSLRGPIIHDVIYKALSEAKIKSKFTFILNDFDPMDGLPVYLNRKVYEKYMGMPFSSIPAPEGKQSLGEYFGKYFIEALDMLRVKPEIIWDSNLYKSGKLDRAIKIVLDNAAKIREIYFNVSRSKKPNDWYPFQVICEKCGKIGTTRVYNWDGKKVSYVCEENLVTWAKGCSHKGEISPFSGAGKMPWKVDWPAKWFALGVTVEGEGKDHAAAGGSRDIANHLCKEVFNIKPPYDIPYEHFLFKGAKMSASKGLGAFALDIMEVLPPEIVRFLMIRNPSRAVEFDIFGVTIPNLFDEYDKAIAAGRGEIDFLDLARVLHFSQAEEFLGFVPRFIKIVYSIQMPQVDIRKESEEEKGSKLTKEEVRELEKRIDYAKRWLKNYAPEEFRFEIQKELPEDAKKLSEPQKDFLSGFIKIYGEGRWNGAELHGKIHDLKNEMGINPKEAFSAIYLVFLGKNSGPQAGWLLASLDKDFVVKRLKEAINNC